MKKFLRPTLIPFNQMILKVTFSCTVRVACDGSHCQRRTTVNGESVGEALNCLAAQGWDFHNHQYYCPSCKESIQEMLTGQGFTIEEVLQALSPN